MQENTNKAIAINTIYLYVRLALTAICMLLTTRFAIKALGVSDFGLFSVLGGVISFITLFNTIMLSTSNRFIAVTIGKGNLENIRDQFNVNLLIHFGIAIVTLIVLLPIGNWYVMHYLNFDGDLIMARNVLDITIIGSVISFIGVPYNGLLMAKEKFSVFCIADVVSHVLKMLAALSIMYFFENKLFVYAIGISVCSALPTFIYYFYCNCHYRDIVRYRFVHDRNMFKEVFSFSAWVGFGAFATIGRSQGASILVNLFFNTTMNAALGLGQNVNSLVSTFAQNVTQPMAPQITKNFAAGNMERCSRLLVMNTKISYLTMLVISSPFLIAPEWIFELWLGQVPPYAVMFLTLLIVDVLIGTLNSGISNIIFASGKIRMYQVVINVNRLVAILFAYIVLKTGAPAYSLLYSYILFTIIGLFLVQWVLNHTIHFDNMILIRQSYLPCLLTTVLAIPAFLFKIPVHPLLQMILGVLYLLTIMWLFALRIEEKSYLKKTIVNKFFKR